MTERRPWPMRWIVLSILVFIAVSTYINLRYRKPSPGYFPYEDAELKRRLVRAGYQRYSVKAREPADPPSIAATAAIGTGPGGLPAALAKVFLEPPLLPALVGAVAAPASADGAKPYAFRFSCEEENDREEFADAKLYRRGNLVYVVPDCEPLTGFLRVRNPSDVVVVTVPPGAFAPGRYRLTLVGRRVSRSWTLQVH